MEKHRITVFCIEYNKTAGEGATVLKSFPQPLTAAEEKYYVQKYTEGDLEAKHILIERNLRLVAHIVKKYQPPPEEMEDLLSIGTIGLMKAVVTFDPEKSAKLATYAARCIENEFGQTVIETFWAGTGALQGGPVVFVSALDAKQWLHWDRRNW